MMGERFAIAVDVGHLIPRGAPLGSGAFPTLAAAVQKITEAAHQQWVSYAAGEALPSGQTIHNATGEYQRSILFRQTGEFSSEVYSDLAYARAIEEGSPARDMKKILSSSLKVRLTKDGRRYLIIPFRHNSPNSVMGNNMPANVYRWWSRPGRETSHIVSTGQRRSGTGAFDIKTRGPLMTPSRTYSWGTKLGADDIAGLGVTGKKAKQLEGMYHFRRPKSEGGGNGQFLTFRVMSEKSKGWIAPAQPGRWPAKSTADVLGPIANDAFREAVKRDIAATVGGVPG